MRAEQDLLQLTRELPALRAQPLAIDQHAAALHAHQHRQQRALALIVQARERRDALELRPQRPVQTQRHVGVAGGVLARALHRYLVEGDLLRALAGDVDEGDGREPQVALGIRPQLVTGRDRVPYVRLEHGVEAHAAQRDALVRQYVRGVLEVVTGLAARRILEQRPE